jgi:diguanylate cyclase (GGDEF)-like protein
MTSPPAARRNRARLRATREHSARRLWSGGTALAFLLAVQCAVGAPPDEAARLLSNADTIKTSNPAEFASVLRTLGERSNELSPVQQEYLHYLQSWKRAYDGDYKTAISGLEDYIKTAKDADLAFRARVTVTNILVVARQYEKAFFHLNGVLEALPKVSDKEARAQAQIVAAQLYNSVGQHDLALTYAKTLIAENFAGRGVCRGGQLQLRALFKSGRLKTVGSEMMSAIDACVKVGEFGYANYIRTYAAQLYIDQERFDDAIKLLKDHYDEVARTQYRLLISDFDGLLAKAYRKKGIPSLARQFALSTITKAVKDEYTEPLVSAYSVLYELAKEQRDYAGALAYHERYAEVANNYLDDVSTRHLAYQKVTHENIANRLQVETLNKQNQVLQLERQLNAKAVEASRLYIALLALSVFFIGLWAYRTKRSQLHFMTLSQLDGLTGICNRPYFIERAQKTLEDAEKTGAQICIVLCDLDHFKAINDSHGHAAGDHVLKRAVSECRALLRSSDIFGRFGGEEFGILLPSCGQSEAWQLSEQLRVAIADITMEHADQRMKVTASFGIAVTSYSGYHLRQLLAHADAALYMAKRSGRNRVVMYEETLSADVLMESIVEQRILDLPSDKKFAAG